MLCFAAFGEGITPYLVSKFFNVAVLGPKAENGKHIGADMASYREACFQLLMLVLVRSFAKASANSYAMIILATARRNFTRRVHETYMSHNYLALSEMDTSLDDVDQRLTSDVEGMFLYGIEFFIGGVVKPEGGILYNALSASVMAYGVACGFPWDRKAKVGPEIVYYTIAFWSCMMVPTFWAANVCSKIQKDVQKQEGAFRVYHSVVRSNAESICFYNGEDRELET